MIKAFTFTHRKYSLMAHFHQLRWRRFRIPLTEIRPKMGTEAIRENLGIGIDSESVLVEKCLYSTM